VLIAFHKPYGVLSQFTPETHGQRTLAEFGFPKDVYPIGRLDADSEGLLLLSDEPSWNGRLLDPERAHPREYWAQVERVPEMSELQRLAGGIVIQGRKTLPCKIWILEPQPCVIETAGTASSATGTERPSEGVLAVRGPKDVPRLLQRNPPIRFRKTVPTCWIGIELVEGRNRQVRRMTAAMGHPTLRLVRVRIGRFWLGNLGPGKWRILNDAERRMVTSTEPGNFSGMTPRI